jgi:hypothetical protein
VRAARLSRLIGPAPERCAFRRRITSVGRPACAKRRRLDLVQPPKEAWTFRAVPLRSSAHAQERGAHRC